MVEDLLANQKPRHPMDAFLKEAGIFRPRSGELVEGEVVEMEGASLYVDLGPRGTGVVFGREYRLAHETIKNLKIGDRVTAKVLEADNEDGYVELSLSGAGEERRWFGLKKLKDDRVILEIPVLEANRGGLILEHERVSGFLPTSQLSLKHYPRVEGGDKDKILDELKKLVGEKLKVRILDVDPQEGKLIFTEKDEDAELIREEIAKHKVGDVVGGEITGVVDFGAFLKFNQAGLEGLIHKSEIDWTLVEDPREVLKPGDEVKAKIIDIHGDRVSLSLKALKEDPWKKIAQKFKKGDTIKGKITKLNPFGAFAELESGVQGLVHISEFGTEERMKEALEPGKEYSFKVLLVDPDEHRVSLGLTYS